MRNVQKDSTFGPRSGALLGVAVAALLVLTTCDLFKPGLGAKVDITPPALSIASPGQNAYVRGTLTITGSAADDRDLAGVTVKYNGAGGPVTRDIAFSGKTWSVDLATGPGAADNLPDGEQQVTLTATDASGKTSESFIIVNVDNVAPTVLVTVPQGYAGSKPVVNSYIDVKGEVWDRSPIQLVVVSLWDAAGTTLVVPAKVANGTNTWSVRFDEVNALADATVYTYKIEVADKAGNISDYYYHSMDIWSLLAAQLPPGSIFPATDDLGKLDQTGTGNASAITYAQLTPYRLTNIGSVHGDFLRNADATRPVVQFANIDETLPVASNIVGSQVPLIGNVNPGPAGNMVNGSSLQAWIIPWSATPTWPATPNVDPADISWTPISTSISFQVKPKVGGVYIASGMYLIKVEATSVGSTSMASLACGFLVDAGAPQIAEVQPAAPSLQTRKTFTTAPLAGQLGIEIRVRLLDDNSAQISTATASLTSGGAALPGLAWDGVPGPDTWYTVQVPLATVESDIWFEIEARDDANTITRQTFHYTIDEVPPTVTIDSPADTSYVTGTSATVNGTATDNNGVRDIYVWLGLSTDTPPADFTTPPWTRIDGSASWFKSLPMGSEGAYAIKAIAVDYADNQSAYDTSTFYLDQNTPTLTETSISVTQAYRNAAFTLAGGADDTNALANVTVTQKKDGGAPVTVYNQATGPGTHYDWNTGAILPVGGLDGTYEYTITVTDIAGKTAPALTRTVIYDTVDPTISVTSLSPVIGANTVNGVVSLLAAVSDASGLGTVEYRYGDTGAFTPIVVNKATPSLTIDTEAFTNLATTNVWLQASDLAGNVTTVSQPLAVDQGSDDPVMSLTNMDAAIGAPAAAGSNLQENNAKVTGTITDDDSVDSSTIQISIDAPGSWVAVSQSGPSGKSVGFEHNFNALSEGIHYFRLRSSDLASAKSGKPAVVPPVELGDVYFAIDRNPPSLAITAPAPGSLHNGDFTVTGTASDANGLAGDIVTINGAVIDTAAVAAGSWSYDVDVSLLTDGAKSWTVEVTDTFGKATTVPLTFTVDRLAPTLAISSPLAAPWYRGATLSTSGTAADLNGVSLVEWSTDNVAWNAATGASSWSALMNLVPLGEGTKTFYARATDAAGNTSVASTVSFHIDQNDPVLTETTIGTGLVGKKALFSVGGSATDTNALTSIVVEQSKDGGAYVALADSPPLPGAWTVASLPRDPSSPATPLLADGIFDYRITLTDIAGNTNVLTRQVQIDTTPPVVVIANPTASAWLSGTAFTASGTATDPSTSVTSVEWSTDGSTWNPALGTLSWNVTLDLTALGEGLQTLQIRATDGSTNTSVPVSRSFGIDQNTPDIAETGIGVSQTSRRADFALSGTAADTVGLQTWDHDANGGTAEVPSIELSINGGAAQKVTVAAGAWSKPITVDPGHADDGQYEYVLTATDLSGKSRSVTRTVIIDSTVPTIAVEGVTAGLNATLNQVNGVITFKFSADGGLVPIEKTGPNYAAYFTVVPDGTPVDTSATGIAGWTGITSAVSQFTLTSNTTTWGAAGAYDLYVGVRDSVPGTPNAGWSKSDMDMDQASDRPLIAFTNVTGGAADPTVNPLGRNARVTGNVEDDDGVGPWTGFAGITGIQISIDGGPWIAVSAPPASIGTLVAWSHDLGLLAEGVHTLAVRARDKISVDDSVYGNGGNYSWSETAATAFFIDFGPPVLAITGPANGSIRTSDFSITGTASDSFGVSTVKISIDGAPEVLVSTSDGYANWSYSYIVAAQDGSHAYQLKAVDLSGAETTLDRQFVVDTQNPSSSVNTPQADEITNGTLSVSGTATDNYQLASVYYWIGIQAASPPDYRGANLTWDGGTGDDMTGWTLMPQTYSWQFNLDTVALGDGAYTLHLRAVDTGGNVQAPATTRNFTVNRASDRPVVTVSTLNPAGTHAENLLPNTLQVAGMISDDDAVDGSTIQVAVDNDGNGTFDPPGVMNWTTVSPAVSNGRVVTWAHTFTGLTDGQYELFVRAADIYDSGYGTYSSASIGPVNFSVDTAAPAGSVTSPAQGAYLNGASVSITGTATDASGIQSVMIKVGAAAPVAVTDTGTNYSTWSYSYAYVADGQVSFQVIVTDVFGKVSTIDRYFTMDRTAPTVSFIQPGPASTVNGSLLVRGEANDNFQVTQVWFAIAQAAPAFPGGYTLLPGTYNWQQRVKTTSYADGAWTLYVVSADAAGNDTTSSPQTLGITIDSATNLPTVTLTTADGTLLDNSGTVTGTISDDDGVDASTIEISLDGGAGWVPVTSHGASGSNVSFTHSVAGLAERTASYNVQVRASDIGEDFAGVTDDIPPVTGTSAVITIKKDNSAPSAAITSLDNGLLTVATLQGVYLKDQLTIDGTSTDGVQVSTVEARILPLGTEPFEAVTNTGTNFSTWTWGKTGLTLTGSSVNVELRVTDFHGRVTSYAYTLLVDTTAPTASIDTPASNPATGTGAYNGTVTFRGSAADAVKVEKVYYIFGTSAAAQPNGTFTGWTQAGSTYSWTTSALDTNALYNDAVDHAYHLSAVSLDSAGNESPVQDLAFTINQTSDRPGLTLSEPTAAQLFGTGAKAFGSSTDDDALASIMISIDGGAYAAVISPASVAGTNVSFENTLAALADGSHTVQVRVRDSGYAGAPAPQQTWHETTSALVAFDIDTAPPALALTEISVQDRYGGAARLISSGFSGSYVNNDSTFTFTATDASGIVSVELSPDGGSTWLPATDQGGGTWTRVLTIPLNQSYDGTRNIQYRATDNYAKVTTAIVTLIVDTLEPLVSFTTPSGVTTNVGDDAPNVNGNVLIQGAVSDSSSITGVTITAGIADQLALTNTGNNISWKVTLAASGTYANATYALSQGSNVWRLPLKITATELAGNRSITTGYIDIDPDSDRPIVSVVSPVSGDSVAGVFLVNGTVVDDDGAQSVRIQVDLNNDGVYGPNGFSGTLDLNGDLDTADDFEDETVYKTVAVTNGAWTILMNTAGELNKSNLVARGLATADGHIGFQVTPVDINATLGAPQTASIYIDSEAPVIKGLAVDGVTETAAPTPTTGTLQKGTITLRALFKDDKDLVSSSMQVSFDGGSSFQNIGSVAGATITDTGATNPYAYRIVIPIDTTTVVAGGNGTLQISLKVTDKTFKQTTQTVQYSVDNTLPEAAWNLPATLSYTGSIPSEVYSFSGTGSTIANEVFGKASDAGAISGIAKVNVYFVKGGNFINPTTGATLAVTTSTERQTSLDRNGDGDYVDLYEYLGSSNVIPFTEDASYVITINMRTELGQFDANVTLGDLDGFNESLKAKAGYDEWYAYFNSLVLPDGPIDVYFVAYDEAGNRVYDKATGQVTNSPPSITGFTVGGQPLTGTPIKVKYSGTVSLVTDADDSGSNPGTLAGSWMLTVAHRYAALGNGDVDLGNELPLTPFFYGTGGGAIRDFSPKTGGAPSSATLSIDTVNDGFVEGDWYLLTVQVTDNDGNVAQRNLYLRVNNSDATAPTATIDDFTQASVGSWTSGQGPLSTDIAAASINTGTDIISVALPSWVTNGTKVMFAGASAPGGFTAATVYYVIANTGSSFQLSATSGGSAVDITSASGTYDLVSGGHVEDAADSSHDGADADLSGAVLITGTVFDSTDVSSLTVEIDGVSQGTAALSNKTGDAVLGFTYNWTYVWDTAKQGMALVAKDNVVVRVYGTDPAANIPLAGARPTKNVDVVPYITSVTDPNGLSTDVLRGATGKYSVSSHATNTLTVKGFNLGSSGVTPAAWVSPTAATPTAGTAPGTTWISGNEVRVSKNLTRSGWLTVVVSAVPSINNVTLNTPPRNVETTSDPRSAQWTDDRYVWVWAVTPVVISTITPATAASTYTYYYPDMSVSPAGQPEFSFTDDNKGNVIRTTSDTAATRRTGFRFNRYASMFATAINTVRQWFIVSDYDTTYGANSDDTGYLEVTGFADQAVDGMTQTTSPSNQGGSNTSWNKIQGNDYGGTTDADLTWRRNNRFPFPKIFAEQNPDTAAQANIYVVYFDDGDFSRGLNFISFHASTRNDGNHTDPTTDWGRAAQVITIPGTSGYNSSKWYDFAKVGAGIAVAYYDPTAGQLKLTYSNQAFDNTAGTGTYLPDQTANVRERTTFNFTTGTLASYVGKYFTIYDGANAYDVWFDTTGAAAKPAGATSPNSIRVNVTGLATAGTIANAVVNTVRTYPPFESTAIGTGAASQTISAGYGNSTNSTLGNLQGAPNVHTGAFTLVQGATNWSTVTIDSGLTVGQHVSVVASGGKLYIAYYDFENANLKLARLDWDATGAPANISSVTIDSYLSAGTWTRLAMINDSSLTGIASAQPFISYYADSYNGTRKPMRLAFPKFDATAGATLTTHGTTSGGLDETYSGSWEVITVQTATTPIGGDERFQHTQIGVYTGGGISLPVVGWVADHPEYAKLQPNN